MADERVTLTVKNAGGSEFVIRVPKDEAEDRIRDLRTRGLDVDYLSKKLRKAIDE